MARLITATDYGLQQYIKSTKGLRRVHDYAALGGMLFPSLRQNVFYFEDDFSGTLNGDYWTSSVDTTGTDYAWAAGQNGLLKGITHTDSGDGAGLRFKNAVFSGDLNAGMEVRMKIDNVTAVVYDLGFADALTDVKDTGLGDIDTPTTANGIGDCAIVGLDTSQTLKKAALVGTNSGAGTTKSLLYLRETTTGWAATADTFFTVRVQLQGNNAWAMVFDENQNIVVEPTYLASALEGGTAVFPYLTASTLTTAAKNVYVDYATVWQDRV